MDYTINSNVDNFELKPTKLNIVDSNLSKTLAIDSSFNVRENNQEKHDGKASRHRKISHNIHKFKEIIVKLQKDISFVINYGEKNKEEVLEHTVLKRLDLLTACIEQLIFICEKVKKGGTTFVESLYSKQRQANELLNKIREDVFQVYLKLDTEEKYSISQRGGQMTCIFTLLGIIEREIHSTLEKISHFLSKRSALEKLKEENQNLMSSKSLPILKSLRAKPKMNNFTMENKKLKNINVSDVNNKPLHNYMSQKSFKESNSNTKNLNLTTTDNPELTNHDSLVPYKVNKNSELNISKEGGKENSTITKNNKSQDSNPRAVSLECKTTGFEISISNENIQIKIPTNVLYLVRSSNNKNVLEKGKGDYVAKSELCPNVSTTILNEVDIYRDSDSNYEDSIYTDIVTDPDLCEDSSLSPESSKHSVNKSMILPTKKNSRCFPLFTKNNYDLDKTLLKKKRTTKSCSKNIQHKNVKKELDSQNNYEGQSFFGQWKESNNITYQYASKLSTICNPLLGNLLEIIGVVKKANKDVDNQKYPEQNQKNRTSSNSEKPNHVPKKFFLKQSPPTIELSNVTGSESSLWKESANLLCTGLNNMAKIWVNNQKDDLLSSTSLDLSKRSDWWPAFGRNVGAPMGSVQPNALVFKPTLDTKALESRLEKILRNAIMKLRPTHRTIWNRYCSSSLKKLLPGLEKAAWSGESISPPDHIQELQHILSSYKMSGFPINMPYTSPSELVDAVKSTGVHMNDAPEIEFSIAVYIHPFPNNVISVWVYVASLIRRR